uniref:Uncharacterized protein n=1 Tax=Romanomermis culicivorax TaxID=13658 RepID=A0A915IZF4_ROMCU
MPLFSYCILVTIVQSSPLLVLLRPDWCGEVVVKSISVSQNVIYRTISQLRDTGSIEAHEALEQLSNATARITNNVPTMQTIDQIIGTILDQLQVQGLQVQCEIKEQTQATNAQFTTLAEQMQQLIATTTAQQSIDA